MLFSLCKDYVFIEDIKQPFYMYNMRDIIICDLFTKFMHNSIKNARYSVL